MDVLIETDTQRLVIDFDDAPDAPYDDGGFPVIYYPYDARTAHQITDITSYVADANLIAGLAIWSGEPDIYARYARVFHGVTSFGWRDTRHGVYVALDPADWRELVGVTDTSGADYSRNMLGEYGDYLDGSCYVAIIQSKCDRGEWHTDDALGGLFGDYAETGAREFWDEHTMLRVSLCTACIVTDANGIDESLTDDDPTPLALLAGYEISAAPCQCSPRVEDCERCREGSFSWATCDGCGQRLGGDRFDYLAFLR